MTTPIFNGAFARLLAGGTTVGLGGADQALTAAQYRGQEGTGLKHQAFIGTGVAASGRKVILPAVTHQTIWQGDADNDYSFALKLGTASVDVAPGQVLVVITDGTPNGLLASEIGAPVSNTSGWRTVTAADSPVTLVAGDHVDFDTTLGAITATLPASPGKFDEIYIRNSAQSFATHALTLARNGATIMGLAQDMTFNTPGVDTSIWFNATTWQLPGAQF